MRIKHMMLMALAAAALTGCSSNGEQPQATDFVDDVKVALADSGRIDLGKLQ